MNTYAKRLRSLKKRLPGNREKTQFEDTFGQPMEEAQNITMLSSSAVRIISELDFVIRLSDKLNGKYDKCISEALDFLEDKVAEQSVLTDIDCIEAEKFILPAAADAKEYKVILVGHAHIDMNWMWGWNETVAAALATFRTVLKLMREYPGFCFSQSQASVYKIVEDYAPEMMDEIKQRIREGRWEVTASAWVETDKNMPNTESLLRHIKYTKNYLEKSWDIDPKTLNIDFSPDTFGHSANIPEIDKQGEVDYYYHCRALDGPYVLYRWRGQSGRETLNYVEQFWYNSSMQPDIGRCMLELEEKCGGLKTGLTLYGVGDHGGGPTRKDIEKAIEIDSWPVFPQYKFGTLREYFREAEKVRDKVPLVEGEMNFFSPGCYTTQSRIKMANRRCETAFSDAECLGALSASLTGGKFNLQGSEDAYRNVLFSHFHDILTGSNVQDSREYAMGLMQHAHAFSQAAATKAMREISDATDTSAFSPEGEVKLSQAEGAGPGYNAGFGYLTPVEERGSGLTRVFTVFNPTPVPRRSNVEITVWDWQGDLRYVTVLNDKKEKIPFQLLDNKMCKFWDHKYFCFVADVEMDALSYATIALKEDFNERYYPVYFNTEKRSQYPTDDFILENENVRVTFDFSTGEMLSFIDKHSGTEYVREGTRAGFVLIDTEADSSDAWRIGRYLSINPVNSARSIHPEYDGEILKGFYVKYAVLDSSIEAHISLENNDKTIKISSKVDWNETAGETVPVLAYSFIPSYTAKEFAYNIPAGAISRKPCEQDHPGLSYIAAVSGDGYNACIVTDCKYGFRGRKNGQLISTLINTANYPDPYPERGIQEFALHVGILPADSAEAEAEAVKLNHPLVYQPVLPHKGSLESSGKLFESKTEAIVISAVAPSDDGAGLIIRMYDPTGKSGHAEFTFNREIIKAYAVDLFEKEVSGDVSVDGKKVSVNVPHNGIITVKIF